MSRVHMYDSVRDHDERMGELFKGYFIGIVLIVVGIGLKYMGVGFGINLVWIGAFIFLIYFLVGKYFKKRYK